MYVGISMLLAGSCSNHGLALLPGQSLVTMNVHRVLEPFKWCSFSHDYKI